MATPNMTPTRALLITGAEQKMSVLLDMGGENIYTDSPSTRIRIADVEAISLGAAARIAVDNTKYCRASQLRPVPRAYFLHD